MGLKFKEKVLAGDINYSVASTEMVSNIFSSSAFPQVS